jgi:hypothetical protein
MKMRERKPETEVLQMMGHPSFRWPSSKPCRRTSRPHHGVEKRTAAHAGRRFKRKNREFLRAQFCTEVARSERFELPTLGFEVRCSIQLSYERVCLFNGLAGRPIS